jgi:uncharacterized protein Yka (UPF0111/DUF47 family)
MGIGTMRLAEILHRLRGRLVPRTQDFFTMFDEQMAVIGDAVRALVQACAEGEFIGQDVGACIKSAEEECDKRTNRIIRLVQETFITPIDREDIYTLAVANDNVMDEISRAVLRLADYRMPLDPMLVQLMQILGACSEILKKEFEALRTLDKRFYAHASEVRPLEREADEIERRMIRESYIDIRQVVAECEAKCQASGSQLVVAAFEEHTRLRQRREVAEILERAVDNCNRVSQIIGNIYVKHG